MTLLDWQRAATVALVALNGAVLFAYHRRLARYGTWLFPATYFLFHYALFYPVRAAILLLRTPAADAIDFAWITLALSYATAFMLCFVVVTLLALEGVARRVSLVNRTVTATPPSQDKTWFFHALYLMCMGMVLYQYVTGTAFAFTDDPLRPDTLINKLIATYGSLRWFVLVYGALLLKRKASRVVVFEVVTLWAAILVQSFVTTAKMLPLNLLLLLIFVAAVTRTQVPVRLTVFLCAVGLTLSVYSFLVREYGEFRGTFSLAKVAKNVDMFIDKIQDPLARDNIGVHRSIDRLNYLDGLAMCIERDSSGALDKAQYSWGSLVELADLMPSYLAKDRAGHNFNRWVSWSVFGAYSYGETPIGRIGESFYVLGYGGIAMGAIHALLFCGIVMALYLRATSLFDQAVYGWVLIAYVVPDAHLLYQYKTLLYVLPVLIALRCIVNVRAVRQNGRMRVLPKPSTGKRGLRAGGAAPPVSRPAGWCAIPKAADDRGLPVARQPANTFLT